MKLPLRLHTSEDNGVTSIAVFTNEEQTYSYINLEERSYHYITIMEYN